MREGKERKKKRKDEDGKKESCAKSGRAFPHAYQSGITNLDPVKCRCVPKGILLGKIGAKIQKSIGK